MIFCAFSPASTEEFEEEPNIPICQTLVCWKCTFSKYSKYSDTSHPHLCLICTLCWELHLILNVCQTLRKLLWMSAEAVGLIFVLFWLLIPFNPFIKDHTETGQLYWKAFRNMQVGRIWYWYIFASISRGVYWKALFIHICCPSTAVVCVRAVPHPTRVEPPFNT